MFIDTHCHLDFTHFDSDREEVIKRSLAGKVVSLINVGSSVDSSLNSRNLASVYPHIFFSLGLHPHYADEFNKEDVVGRFQGFFNDPKLVAIGEVGLDYYRRLSSLEKQKETFKYFISLAKELNLPLIIHCREAEVDTYEMLSEQFSIFNKVVLHCFSGSEDFMKKCLRKGAMFSFTANITYPNAYLLRKVIEDIPLEAIMIETDAPYLPPQEMRGKRNEPVYIEEIAKELAAIKCLSLEKIAEITSENAIRFFGLKNLK